jgi:putative aminopeptidase FrvX
MFRIGQRVRFVQTVPGYETHEKIGIVGTIIAAHYDSEFGDGWKIAYEGVGIRYSHSCELEQVDDLATFERFMERVMKPVNLDQPMTA